jgi:hypothetical protein
MQSNSFSFILLISSALIILDTVYASVHSKDATVGKEEVKMKWFVFREECFDIFFNKHDFTNVNCIKLTLSKCVGYAIVGGSAILKLP